MAVASYKKLECALCHKIGHRFIHCDQYQCAKCAKPCHRESDCVLGLEELLTSIGTCERAYDVNAKYGIVYR